MKKPTYQDVMYNELNSIVKTISHCRTVDGLASAKTRKNFARKNKRFFKNLGRINTMYKCLPNHIN